MYIQQNYPLALSDLVKEHLELLVKVLSLDISIPEERLNPLNVARIKDVIKELPWDLRRHAFIRVVPNAMIKPAYLCEAHHGLNPYVINHTLSLLQREVTVHLKCITRYTGEHDMGDVIAMLKGIRGLWSTDVRYKMDLELMKASHQHNGCEACMLAQVLEAPTWLQYLRTTLLSRTRTRAKPGRPHRAPQLLRLIDGGIELHKDFMTEIFYHSGQDAYEMKEIRKSAVREYRRRKFDPREDCPDDPDDKYKKHETIVVYWDHEAEESGALSGRTAVETGSPETAVEDTEDHKAIVEKEGGEERERKLTPSELLLEQIIAEYAGLTGTEDMEGTEFGVFSTQPDLAPPTPLSIRKQVLSSPTDSRTSSHVSSPASSSASSSPCRLSSSSSASPPSTPPTTPPSSPPTSPEPSVPVWPNSTEQAMESGFTHPRDIINWRKVIQMPSPLDNLSSRAETASQNINGNAELIAFEYRDLLSPRIAFEYSESEYSRSPMKSPRRATTWDLVARNSDIKYPVPHIKEINRGGLAGRFKNIYPKMLRNRPVDLH